MVRSAGWNVRFDLKCDTDTSAHDSGQMGDDFLRDASRVTADTQGIQLNSAMEALWARF